MGLLIREVFLSLVAWIIAGLITGCLVAISMGAAKWGFLRDILLGIVGAVIGGNFYNLIWTVDVNALNYPGLLLAAAGALALLGAHHLVRHDGVRPDATRAQSRR